MSRFQTSCRTLGVVIVVIALASMSAVVAPAAQTQTRETATATETKMLAETQAQTEALKSLVAEVRALRAVIEQYTQGQVQSQTMTELLNVQQRRVADATARLDVAQRELAVASNEARRIATEVSQWEDAVRKPPTDAADAARRRDLESMLQDKKQELDRQAEKERQLRLREADLLSAVGLEEASWNEMVARVNRTLAR